MPSAITNDVVELAMVGRLYQALSDCAVLRTRLEAANAEAVLQARFHRLP